jgi:hypothetical protein
MNWDAVMEIVKHVNNYAKSANTINKAIKRGVITLPEDEEKQEIINALLSIHNLGSADKNVKLKLESIFSRLR